MNSMFIYTLKYTDEASNIVFDEDIMKNNYMLVMLLTLSVISQWIFPLSFFSSPEHEVLMVSYCDRAVSGVRRQLFNLCTL